MDEYIATPKQWRVFHGKIEYICRKPIKSTLYTVGMMTDSRKKRKPSHVLCSFTVCLNSLSLCPSYTYIHVYYVISLNLYLLNS